MASVSDSELLNYVSRKHSNLNGVLLFGTEEANIATAARQVMSALKLEDEPQRFVSSALRNDPGALDDAFRAMSLLGGRQAILVDGCEETHASWLAPIVQSQTLGNFVVLLAGSLNKSSKLRAAATESQRFAATGFYEESAESLLIRIRNTASARGLSFAEGAAERFAALCGTDRGIVDMELEKLCTYVLPAKEITVDDVEASCGDQASFDFDKLTNAVMEGRLVEADRIFDTLRADGEWKQSLIMLQMHLTRLEQVRAAIDRGDDMEKAFRAAKPPVFFGAQKAIARQVKSFGLADIVRAQVQVQQAILQSRQFGDLAETLTGRVLLSLARTARQLQSA
jgi:DNA polymerase III subunit delta